MNDNIKEILKKYNEKPSDIDFKSFLDDLYYSESYSNIDICDFINIIGNKEPDGYIYAQKIILTDQLSYFRDIITRDINKNVNIILTSFKGKQNTQANQLDIIDRIKSMLPTILNNSIDDITGKNLKLAPFLLKMGHTNCMDRFMGFDVLFDDDNTLKFMPKTIPTYLFNNNMDLFKSLNLPLDINKHIFTEQKGVEITIEINSDNKINIYKKVLIEEGKTIDDVMAELNINTTQTNHMEKIKEKYGDDVNMKNYSFEEMDKIFNEKMNKTKDDETNSSSK